jgi:hypothetical protein
MNSEPLSTAKPCLSLRTRDESQCCCLPSAALSHKPIQTNPRPQNYVILHFTGTECTLQCHYASQCFCSVVLKAQHPYNSYNWWILHLKTVLSQCAFFFHYVHKQRVWRRSCVSVCPSTFFNSRTIGRIFIIFDIRGPYRKLQGHLDFYRDRYSRSTLS